MRNKQKIPVLKIESGVPLPTGRLATEGMLPMLRDTLHSMRLGESFVWLDPNVTYLYRAAKQSRISITTRKLDSGGVRVWRIK